jgi:sugar O-acyltransferase (sialic acid O-acetyltransferase NeuD family)
METSRDLVIYGAGGHALGVANVAIAAGFAVRYCIDPNKTSLRLMDIPIIASVDDLPDWRQFSFSVGIGDNFAREQEHQALAARYPDMQFPALIHPRAAVSYFTTIGEGSVLMANAIAGTNSRVGRFCIMSIQTAMGHDCLLDDFASMAPSCVIAGSVTVGQRSAVSMAASVCQGVAIGQDCVLGANSFLRKNLSDQTVAYGSPAREVRQRNPGEPYL